MKPNDKAIEAGVKLCWDCPRATPSMIRDILTAAYAAQFPPSEDYAGLVKELREDVLQFDLKDTAYENTAKEAADEITRLRAERDALKDLLPNQSHEGRAPIPTDWWSVAVLERRKRRAAEKERDALLARLAPVKDEALVEIVAKHFIKENKKSPYTCWKKAARDAIAAARPHIEAAEREKCVKAVETVGEKINVAHHERPEWEDGYLQGVYDAAAAIRSGK